MGGTVCHIGAADHNLTTSAAMRTGSSPAYEVGFKVRPGNHRLALTVTDALGSTASTLTWNVSISGNGAVTVTNR
jgi:hypothetical protein